MGPKKLQNYYIKLLMETLSEDEYKKEVERLRNIISANPKPKRSKESQEFIDFIDQKIYKNNTAFDILKSKFNLQTDNASYEFWMSKTGLTKEQMQKEVQEAVRLAGVRIKDGFKKYQNELNKMLHDK